MRVKEIMSTDVAVCRPEDDLARAAVLLFERDCGALPVVQDDTVVGVITDRDIAIAGATKGRPLHAIAVGEVASPDVWACVPDDDVRTALDLMAANQVRRIPVVDSEERIRGILSLNDVLQRARGGSGSPSPSEIVAALKEIGQRRTEEAAVS